jgi:hypothetical protein
LPLERWPEANRQAWAAAIAPGDVLDAGGAAAIWRPHSRRNAGQARGTTLPGSGAPASWHPRSGWGSG